MKNLRLFLEWAASALVMFTILVLLWLFATSSLFATTWYVNSSGGTRYTSNEIYGMCNGQSSAPYPGTTNKGWMASTAFALNTEIVDNNGNYETATTAGTTSATFPTFPAHGVSGATTADGTVVWTSGTTFPVNQACAFFDIRFLWADGSYNASGTFPGWGFVGASGDTYLIDCSGMPNSSCRVGYSGPNSGDYYLGFAGDPGGSGAPGPPPGTAGAHTKLLGVNYANCASPSAKTKINGGYGVGGTINLQGDSYVDIACFDITDHSSCGKIGTANQCATAFPMDDYAADGIVFSRASTNITLTDINIHGMANSGLFGPTGDSVSLTRVAVTGNTSSGWNMDAGDATTGTGHLNFEQFATIFNGCSETYPITTTLSIPYYSFNGGTVGSVNNCFDDGSSGYGDGIGTATVVSSPAWIMTMDKSIAAYNTQDGFDLLHLQGGGSTITVTNSYAFGNMGQQLKTGAAGVTYNNYFVGNCNALRQAIPGLPAGYNTHLSDYCRAADVTVVVTVGDGATTRFQNNTILTAGAIGLEVPVYGSCSILAGSTCLFQYENNVVLGFTNNTANGYPTGGTGNNPQPLGFDNNNPLGNAGSLYTNNATHGQKAIIACPDSGESNAQCGDPGLVDETFHLYGAGNVAPAVANVLAGKGIAVAGITTDINGASRANPPTIGAYEVVVPPAIPVGGGTINGRIASLTWVPSPTPNTTVNVYRCAGTECTSFAPIASGQTSTSYADASVAIGDYSYYVTAVANGKESKPSNTATVTVRPQPPTGLSATTQ